MRNTLGYIRSSSASEIVSSFNKSAITRPSVNKPNSMSLSGQDANLNSCNAVLHNSAGINNHVELCQPINKVVDINGGPTLGPGFNSGGILSYEKWSSAGDGISLSGINTISC